MTDVAALVARFGGMAQKQQLVRRGARDRHLTAAVRDGGVVRVRNGWYSTLDESDPRLRAVRVGGRLTGISLISALGGWVFGTHPLHVAVAENAARLRAQNNRRRRLDFRAPRGVVVHWTAEASAERGTATSVALVDALRRVVLDENLETAVAALDWARHRGLLDDFDLEAMLLKLPQPLRAIGDWVDAACESLPESLARTRLRLAGHTVATQVPLARERIDLVVDGTVGIEVDGAAHHGDSFERDRAKDLRMTIAGYHAMRPSARMVFHAWEDVLRAVEVALAERGRVSSSPVGNSGVLGPARGRSPGYPRKRCAVRAQSPEFSTHGRHGARDRTTAWLRSGGEAKRTNREYREARHVELRVSEAIKVDIWSDVQCPWCYIGKRKFEAGAKQSGVPVEVEYHSFELAPDTPVDFDGTPVEYLAKRKGIPLGQVEQMLERVTAIAESVGLDYDYDHVHQTNTVISHELLHFAKSKGRQLEMKERLLKAYFVNGEHVGRIPDLVDIAAELGYDRAEVTEALESHRFLADVKADVALANEYGIQGVPFFVIDGKYGVSGAQDAATFANVLTQVRSEREAV